MARLSRLVPVLALAFAALELGARVAPYGFFHDELYYWACAMRPGLGYVDHPPFAPWVLAASVALFGDGRLGFEIVPALCGAATLLLTGTMAARFGAGRFGQLLAALCLVGAPFTLILFSFFSVNAIEIFLWSLACFLMLELIRTGDERLWAALGLVAGIGILNKHTFALLGFGLAVGVAATPLRARLRGRWLWSGIAAAALLALPNLLWNLAHGWPSLEFYRTRPSMDLPASFAEALALQLAGSNIAAVLVWVPGAAFLLFSRAGRPYRPLGIAFLTLLAVILFSGQRRGDRIAGIYPVAWAAGAAFWDRLRVRWSAAARWAVATLVLAAGALALPIALPVLPPAGAARYLAAFGDVEIEAADAGGHGIPLYLMGRLDWERVAEEVAAATLELGREERERAVVLAPHWVIASVVEYYGRERGLPPVVSPHNAYYFWREPAAGRDVAISVAIEPEVLSRYFAETRQIGTFRCEHCVRWRPDMPILVSSRPVRPLEQLLEEWRYFGIDVTPALRR